LAHLEATAGAAKIAARENKHHMIAAAKKAEQEWHKAVAGHDSVKA